MNATLKPWAIVIWPEGEPRIVEFYDRWLDAYDARPDIEKMHQCDTSIESTQKVSKLSWPYMAFGRTRLGKTCAPVGRGLAGRT